MPDQTSEQHLTISVDRTVAEHALQINLSRTDADGNGEGYRLAGPKHYNLGVTELLEHELTERDAVEVRQILDAVFPATVYELRKGIPGDRPETIATYANPGAARAHGEDAYRQRFGSLDELAWCAHSDTLHVLNVTGEDGQFEADWHIVARVLPAVYSPEGGAR